MSSDAGYSESLLFNVGIFPLGAVWQLSRLFMAAALALMTIARDICVFGDESQETRTTTVGVSH